MAKLLEGEGAGHRLGTAGIKLYRPDGSIVKASMHFH
jgi:hypothetical protein